MTIKKYEANDILMSFVDNHDENSWNGTIQSRLGKAEEAMTALVIRSTRNAINL